MNYKNIRKNKGFDKYFIAYKLGIRYSDYFNVEKGARALSGEKLDLFNEIVSDNLNIIEQNELYKESKEWLNNTNIKEAIKQFGYTPHEIATCLCVSNSYVSKVTTKQYYNDSIVLGLYLFLTDENNRIYANSKLHKVKRTNKNNTSPNKDLELKEKNNLIDTLKSENKLLMSTIDELNVKMKDYLVLSIRCNAYEELLLKNRAEQLQKELDSSEPS